MPSLDDLKKRIKSVKSTQKITKAMKMVAAAKLRKAQESAEKGRPYSQKMQNIILNLTKSINDPESAPKLLVGTGKDETYLCVVMTADRGLCGGFNSNICKLAKNRFKKILNEKKNLKIITVGSKGLDQIRREYGKYVINKFSFKDKKKITYNEAEIIGKEIINLFNQKEFDRCILFYNNFKKILSEGKELKIMTVGTKGLDQIKREYGKYVIKKFSFKDKKQIKFSGAEIIGNEIIKLFKEDQFDKCILFYNNFKNVITQIPQAQQIIPAKNDSAIDQEESQVMYEFEPEEDEILEDLLPKNISTQVFKAFLENAASEQGSRMTAMDNATRNAGDLVDKLTINYNRSRQASITKELIEIISVAESL